MFEIKDEYLVSADLDDLKNNKIVIPSNVKIIGENTFSNNSIIEEVEMSDSVLEIAKNAFNGCTKIKKVKFSNNLTEIKSGAFNGCESLEEIEFPNSLVSIADEAFSDCKNLKRIKFSEGIVKIGDYAFSGCIGLVQANIPSSLEYIGNEAFRGCKKLTGAIKLDCKNIGFECFAGCSRIKSIELGNNISALNYCEFQNCTSLNNVKLSKSLKRIGPSSFENCRALKFLQLPDSIKEIEEGAFNNTVNLKKINLFGKEFDSNVLNFGIISQKFNDFSVIAFTVEEKIKFIISNEKLSKKELKNIYNNSKLKKCEDYDFSQSVKYVNIFVENFGIKNAEELFVNGCGFSNLDLGIDDTKVLDILNIEKDNFSIQKAVLMFDKWQRDKFVKKEVLVEKESVIESKNDELVEIPQNKYSYIPIVFSKNNNYRGRLLTVEESKNENTRVFVVEKINQDGIVQSVVVKSKVYRNENKIYFDDIKITTGEQLEYGTQKDILDIYKNYANLLIKMDESNFKKLLDEGSINELQYQRYVLKEVIIGIEKIQLNILDDLVLKILEKNNKYNMLTDSERKLYLAKSIYA